MRYKIIFAIPAMIISFFAFSADKVSWSVDNLPPEPGPENNLTVAGIDSDKDGVRDDVQRYIVLKFPHDEATRLALLDVARAWQFGLTEADIPEAAYKNTKNFFSKYECMLFISRETASDYIVDMRSVLLNTTLRSDAYIRYNNNAAGNNYISPPTKDYYKQCSFDVKALLGEG